ncbi:CPXCG motif-containing cysteine-rich protein [Shewanella waksmanii]|uniref:CPXCG motif-containing cysteine-rich protein n=1 Tax=Shewanella waksmanii TaxID=213783 RepID=UPI00048F095B|nr:CPXCG motif-containing cysteine-rich protein [Shewanella waksmanii]
MKLINKSISCPHCGHNQHIEIDTSGNDQEYYQDCKICCNPIHFRTQLDRVHQKLTVFVDSDDEQYY